MREANILDKTRNTDWPKTRTWDIYIGSVLVTRLDELFKIMGHGNDSQKDKEAFLNNFIKLPAWKSATQELKDEAKEFLSVSSRERRVRKKEER